MFCVVVCVVCFFKQKTAYEMRISDWSSDVCSSDLASRDDPASSDASKAPLASAMAAAAGLVGCVQNRRNEVRQIVGWPCEPHNRRPVLMPRLGGARLARPCLG